MQPSLLEKYANIEKAPGREMESRLALCPLTPSFFA
jgi:hypothetical protein